MSSGDGMTTVMRRAQDLIAKHGFTVISVFGENGMPGFSYSVGLTEINHPEVLISGIQPDIAGGLISDTYARIIVGERFDTEMRDDKTIGGGFEVIFRPVKQDSVDERVRLAAAIYPDRKIRAVQIIWPDENGAFPDKTTLSQMLFTEQS